MSPAVSVVLPSNRWDQRLDDAVASLLRQTFADIEILVVDDRVDPTDHRTREWEADKRVHVLVSGGAGLVTALNLGLSHARGKWIARMDDDDLSHRDRLGLQVRFLANRPDVQVLGTRAWAVTEKGGPLFRIDPPCDHEGIIQAVLSGGVGLIHPTIIADRELLVAAGGYGTCLPGAEDLDLWLRLTSMARFANVRSSLLLYRIHSAQASRQHSEPGLRLTRRAQEIVRLRQQPHSPAKQEIASQIVSLERDLALSRDLAHSVAIVRSLIHISGLDAYGTQLRESLRDSQRRSSRWGRGCEVFLAWSAGIRRQDGTSLLVLKASAAYILWALEAALVSTSIGGAYVWRGFS